jgi:ABC-type transport system involved in multi-copper enzyme maturation permease subunit
VREVAAVFFYECRRMLTPGRLVWWLTIAGFPVAITLLIRWSLSRASPKPEEIDAAWSLAFYMLVPGVCTALGVLVTAGPAVASELEQRSWIYLASRPYGVPRLLIGKYLAAVTFGCTAAWTGLSLSVPLSTASTKLRIWLAMSGLSGLAAASAAAIFLFLGTIALRRAMVMCMAWAFLIEGVLGSLPAVVNRFTTQYRLRSILVQWLPLPVETDGTPVLNYAIGSDPVWQHICWILALTATFLMLALVVARRREFTAAVESDV